MNAGATGKRHRRDRKPCQYASMLLGGNAAFSVFVGCLEVMLALQFVSLLIAR